MRWSWEGKESYDFVWEDQEKEMTEKVWMKVECEGTQD